MMHAAHRYLQQSSENSALRPLLANVQLHCNRDVMAFMMLRFRHGAAHNTARRASESRTLYKLKTVKDTGALSY